MLLRVSGGGGGIRTRETIHHRLHALQACAFDRSATPPLGRVTLTKPTEPRNKPPAVQSIPSELFPFGGGKALSSAERSSSVSTTLSAPRLSRTCSRRAAFGITIMPSWRN